MDMKPRKIKDLKIKEVSLVDRAANRKKFIICKGTNQMKFYEKIVAVLKGLFGEDVLEEADHEIIKSMSDERGEAVYGALNSFSSYEIDEFPEDIQDGIITLAKFAVLNPVEKTVEKEAEITADLFIEKAGAVFSKTNLEKLRKMKEMIDSIIGDKEKVEKSTGEDKLPEEVKVKLRKLEEVERKEEERIRKVQEEKEAALTKTITDLTKKVEDLLKSRASRQSLTAEDEDDDEETTVKKKGDVQKWPSI